VDLFLIHWPDGKTPEAEMMGTLKEVVQSGKTRYIGVSNFTADMLRASKPHADICASQVGYNLFDRRWERQMFSTARELSIGIMAYGPMAHGLLTGTFTADTTFLDWDWRSRGDAFGQALFKSENFPKNVAVAGRLKRVVARLDTTLPKLAIAWVLSNPAMSVALSGTRTSAEIEHNVGALDTKLDQATLDEIDQIMSSAQPGGGDASVTVWRQVLRDRGPESSIASPGFGRKRPPESEIRPRPRGCACACRASTA
jgi:aryl-alcohol dehydrogenase-like predicted oxidoreductase